MSKDLQKRFKELTDSLNELKLEEARAESQLDSIIEKKDLALKNIKALANVSTLEEAEEKLNKLQERLNVMLNEAEELLNGGV
jgi:chromosome segregation ATPase